jgi:hypothetical protein
MLRQLRPTRPDLPPLLVIEHLSFVKYYSAVANAEPSDIAVFFLTFWIGIRTNIYESF